MNGKKLMQQSAVLAGGYAIGQGSTFTSQLFIKEFTTPEMLGAAVLIVGYCSFCLQFSDLGNSNRSIPLIRDGMDRENTSFLTGRAFIGSLATATLLAAGGIPIPSTAAAIATILLIALAYLRGNTFSAQTEFEGDYIGTATIQSLPWMALSIGLLALCLAPSHAEIGILPIVCTTLVSGALFATHRPPKNNNETPTLRSITEATLSAVQYIGPALCGQLWGRAILILTKDSYGFSSLGVLGLAKYGQVGLTLVFSFWMRPIHRMVSIDANLSRLLYQQKLRIYSWPLAVAAMVSLLTVAVCLDSRITARLGQWPLLLSSLPFFVGASIASQHYSSKIRPTMFMTVELFSLSANVVVFALLYKSSLVLAIVLGETTQYLIMMICAYFFDRYVEP